MKTDSESTTSSNDHASMTTKNDMNHRVVKNHNMRNNVFSDDSTQAVYEGMEVQHQSKYNYSQGRVRDNGNNYTWSTNTNGAMRTSGKSVDSSSQEKSVSTWFPVPSLPIFQSKSKGISRRVSTPNSHEIPFDENKKFRDRRRSMSRSPVSSNEQLGSPQNQNHRLSPSMTNLQNDQSHANVKSISQDRPWRTNSSPREYKASYQNEDISGSNNHMDMMSKASPSSFNSNRKSKSPRGRQSPRNHVSPFSSNGLDSHTDEQSPQYLGNLSSSMSSVSPREGLSPRSYEEFASSDRRETQIKGQSPRRYRNPFSSNTSESALFEQTKPLRAMKAKHNNSPELYVYRNPFDSASMSAEEMQQMYPDSSSKTRKASRSPERQRVRATTALLTNDSKLHNLLSCATSPSDPKWMEAMKVLANSPNPTQLAKMKISHAHNWTALHIAALSNPPLYVIYGLLLVYPDAVREMDSGGRLPIHLAAGSEASASVLSILVRFYNDSVMIKEGRGLIPLHLALLRDGGEEMSSDIIRVLLGQSSSSSKSKGLRRVRDGGMRRGEHLNLKLADVKTGIFGENKNAISMKERRKREIRIENMEAANNWQFTRGFAPSNLEIDSTDGIPYKHDHLVSLWEDDGVIDVDTFGNTELIEAKNFGFEVQNYLRKLAKYKKKLSEDNSSEQNQDSEHRINPAYISATKMRLPIHMAIKRNFSVSESFRLSIDKQNDILRLLINANPSSLMCKDKSGKTPITTCLELIDEDSSYEIDLEMIELLLGLRTRDFRVAPHWLEDVDIVESQQNLFRNWDKSNSIGCNAYNPAMIQYGETLPLHIAVSKVLPPSIIYTIYSCFPGAKYVQDENKCTPLHSALQPSSDKSHLDLNILALLIDKRVIPIRDSWGHSALDLLIGQCKNGRIPNYSFSYWQKTDENLIKDIKSQIRVLFQHSFLEASASKIPLSDDHNPEALRYLPATLRNYAFETDAVQKVLITKVSSPFNTALILINAIALLTFALFFIGSLDIGLDKNRIIPETYVWVVTISIVYLALNGLLHALMTFRLQIGWKCCIYNIWSYVTLVGLVVTSSTYLQLLKYDKNGDDVLDKNFLFLINSSIALVWVMIIGFISRWCYGVSLLCLSAVKMIKSTLPTISVLIIVITSFMQMIYVVQRNSLGYDGQCVSLDDQGASEVCSIWDAISIPYYLATGGTFSDSGSDRSNGLAIPFILMIILIFILVVHSVASTIVNMKKFTSTESIVDFYWLPMLTHILLVRDFCDFFACNKNKTNTSEGRDIFGQRKLGIAWDNVCASFASAQIKNTKDWSLQQDYSHNSLLTNTFFVRFVGIFLIPVWLILGLLTFGILWPPQCRRWLFTWSFGDAGLTTDFDEQVKSNTPMSLLREDVSRMKGMIYERFHDMQQDIQDVKNAIH